MLLHVSTRQINVTFFLNFEAKPLNNNKNILAIIQCLNSIYVSHRTFII